MTKPKRRKPADEDAVRDDPPVRDDEPDPDPPAAEGRVAALHALLKLMLERHEIPAHRVEQLTSLLDH